MVHLEVGPRLPPRAVRRRHEICQSSTPRQPTCANPAICFVSTTGQTQGADGGRGADSEEGQGAHQLFAQVKHVSGEANPLTVPEAVGGQHQGRSHHRWSTASSQWAGSPRYRVAVAEGEELT